MKKIRPDTKITKEEIIIGKPVDEIEELRKIVASFNSLDEESRYRVMKYLTDRFSKYVPNLNA